MKYLERLSQDHLRYVSSTWFNYVGIVVIFDSITKSYKAYIKDIEGLDEDIDILDIANSGNHFPLKAARALFPNIDFDSEPKGL